VLEVAASTQLFDDFDIDKKPLTPPPCVPSQENDNLHAKSVEEATTHAASALADETTTDNITSQKTTHSENNPHSIGEDGDDAYPMFTPGNIFLVVHSTRLLRY